MESGNNFHYLEALEQSFERWVGTLTPEMKDALRDMSGDTYFEMRKLVSLVLSEVENEIKTGRYAGFKDGVALTQAQKTDILNVEEDLKVFLRKTIEASWRSVLTKQRTGMDSLFQALSRQRGYDRTD
jgi:hypothetical protein